MASAAAEPATAPARRRRLRLRAALLALLCAGWALLAAAHPMPESRVWVDTTAGGLRLTLQLPLDRLEYGFGQPLADAPATVLARHGDALSRYLLLHVGARSGGLGWQVLRPQLAVDGSGAGAELRAVLELRAPPGADPRLPTLLYDAITHEVRTHRVQVLLRNDWAGGVVGAPPLPLGELSHAVRQLPLVLQPARFGASTARLLRDGALHIADGSDHLLFLLLLMWVAPLTAQAGRWRAPRTAADTARHIAWVVTAFTLGHTATLVLASAGLLSAPARAVEAAVALSIAVAAVHAWRPLFARAEAAMALLFGLVHGLAFAASLSGAGLSPAQHALALLSFNLGIEAMQLLLLAAVLPPLWRLAHRRPPWYGGLRRAAAAAALVVALLWLAERLGADPWPAWLWLDTAASRLRWLPLALWPLAALAGRGAQARSPPPAGQSKL